MKALYLDGELLYSPDVEALSLINPTADYEVNKTGSLSFFILPGHPLYDKVKKLESDIEIREGNKVLSVFRVLNDKKDFNGTKYVTCEGDLSFLVDSVQRPYEHKGGIKPFFQSLIATHNEQVENRKKFTVGTVNVSDNNDYINRSNGNYSTTLSELSDKLVKTHAGYVRTRRENGTSYIDYVSDYGHVNSQVIRFSENLLDLTQHVKAEDVRTAIIPLGKQTDEEGINGVKKRIDIKTVNGNKDYLVNDIGVSLFGYIWETVYFNDVTLPINLKNNGKKWLDDAINMSLTIELSAIDLSLVDVNVETIQIGDWIRVVSEPHGVDKLFMVSKLHMDFQSPELSKIVLGATLKSFTGDTVKKDASINGRLDSAITQVGRDIFNSVANATELITGGKGGYIHTALNKDGMPEELFFMDTPATDDAKNMIRINKNGIGFSTSGIDGPYFNAWTIDGKLVADFMTTGIIRSNDGRSFWNLDSGEMQLSGVFRQYAANNLRSVTIANNMINFYAWEIDGDFVGSISSVAYLKTGKRGVAILSDIGDSVSLGVRKADGEYADVIKIDNADDVPYIRNAYTGSFPIKQNSNYNINVKNGLITGWEA